MKIGKRLLSIFLTLSMLLGYIPAAKVKADTVKPGIASSNPVNYQTDVDVNIKPTIVFTKDMDVSSDGLMSQYSTYLYEVGGISVKMTKNYDAATKTLTITPESPLQREKAYFISLSSYYCKDTEGNGLEKDVKIYFSTPGAGDKFPPELVDSYPQNNATAIPTDVTCRVTFNEDMDANTVNSSNIAIQEKINAWTWTDVPGGVTVNYDSQTRTATIKPASNLKVYADYRLYIRNGVKDIAGNKIEEKLIVFKTDKTDVTGPEIVSTNIADGAKGVLPETKFQATFNEPIKQNYNFGYRLQDNVVVKKNGVELDSGTLGIDLSSDYKTLNIPGRYNNTKWEKGATYEITIKGGLVDNFDNPMGKEYKYTFTAVENDTTPPVLKSITPQDGATGVEVRPVIKAVFNEKLSRKTYGEYDNVGLYIETTPGSGLWNKVKMPKPGGASWETILAYSITYDETDKDNVSITMIPQIDLLKNRKYKIMLQVSDEQYNSLNPYEFYFTTGSGQANEDSTPPTIVSTYPEKTSPKATNIPVNMSATVKFSEAMKEDTLNNNNAYIQYMNSSYQYVKVDSYLQYDKTTNVLTITPKSNLEYKKSYMLVVKNVEDLAGNILEAEYNCDFETEINVKPLKITAIYPEDGAVEVPIDKRIKITFDEKLSFITSDILSNLVVKENGTVVPTSGSSYVTVSVDNNVLYISKNYKTDGTTIWTKGTKYEVTLKRGIKDQYGNTMSEDKTWTFTTIQNDTVPPVLKSLTPNLSADKANPTRNVGLLPTFTAIFNESLDPGSYGDYGGVAIYYDNGYGGFSKLYDSSYKNGWTVTCDETDKNNVVLTVKPKMNLVSGKLYKLTLAVKDRQYNLFTPSDYYFVAGEVEQDLIPPSIIETKPINGAKNVALDSIINVKFSEKMKLSTINENSVYLLKEGNKIDASISYDDTQNQVTITPKTSLFKNSTYTIVVENTVEDLAGNKMTEKFQSVFSTEVEQIMPMVESIKVVKDGVYTDLKEGATDVPYEDIKFEILFNKLMDEKTIKNGWSEYIYITANADKTPDYTMTSLEITTVNGKTKVTIGGFFGWPLVLETKTKYYLVIPNTVKDVDGNTLNRFELGFTTGGNEIVYNKILKVDVDRVPLQNDSTAVTPTLVNLNPKKITILSEKPLLGMDVNDGSVKLWYCDGTTYGTLLKGAKVTIEGNKVVVDVADLYLKENGVYKLQIKDYLTAEDNAPLDKEYVYYFKPVRDNISFTLGTISIEGNTIIPKDNESVLTVKGEVNDVKEIEFSIIYNPQEVSVLNVELKDELKTMGVTVQVVKEDSNEIGKIIFKGSFSEATNLGELMKIKIKSLNGNRSKMYFSDILYIDKNNVPQYAMGNGVTICGETFDLNMDGKVSILDLILVTRAFGINKDSDKWEELKGRDLNGDGKIDEKDADIIKAHFGEKIE
ncbi:hypothetical protein Q428_10905 [Fervidicella metallireducens AeB]|uniref:Dockerin domain-containing protein n=1 Tax=Fervidicella metallireducens AeB TaxID=1403537 RepID=A0A017RT84_9CLOT|nr:Ig-like domain-containing protein [Fervidicella metallireducens]EYE87882.1 hypothetical protein Q428_10905 [Fervidicella metallireducens AeB]